MPIAKKSLQGWFAAMLSDKSKEELPSQVTLIHQNLLPNGTPVPKEIWSLKANVDKPWDAETIAKMVQTQAELYCQNMQTVQQFTIVLMFGKNDANAEHPFQINPTEGSEFQSLISHPPTAAGKDAMGMSLLNMICGRSFTLLEENMDLARGLVGEYRQGMQQFASELRETRAENSRMFELLQMAAMDKIKLGHEQRMAEAKYLRETAERGMIIKYAPALINQFLGKEIFPQGVEDTAILETIAAAIPEEQLKMITSMMPPLMGGPIMARLTKALKDEREAQAHARAAVESGVGTNPQLPPGGGGMH